jgi:GntP family gluconate:H+ symporter
MDAVSVSALGAIVGLAVAIILILKQINPTYAMMFGAISGGIVGGVSLSSTVGFMIAGTQSIVPAIVRIVAAGVLAGMLIETGSAERIADSIVKKIGARHCLIAMMLATWVLTAVGVFGDVAIITVAPIAIPMAKRAGFHKLGVLMAMIGGVKAGNVMSPNPNAIAASETFGVPLTSVMLVGVVAALAALITTTLLSRVLAYKGTNFTEHTLEDQNDDALPPLWAALFGPAVTIGLLMLRPICGLAVDPLVALPLGGLAGMVAAGKIRHIRPYLVSGLGRMTGVAMLLIGTGALAGIISHSQLKDVITSAITLAGLPPLMLAPIAGTLMGAATASSTAGTLLGGQIFGPAVISGGISPLAGAAMTHAGSFVFDGLPHGSFFHVSAGTVGMEISERLRLIAYESFNGLVMVAVSTLVFGVLKLAG